MPERKRLRNILFSFTPLALMISAACTSEFSSHVESKLHKLCEENNLPKAILVINLNKDKQVIVGRNPFEIDNTLTSKGNGKFIVENSKIPPTIVNGEITVINKQPKILQDRDDLISMHTIPNDPDIAIKDNPNTTIVFSMNCPKN